MRLPKVVLRRLNKWFDRYIETHKVNQIIGPEDDVYLWRWYWIPRNRFFNVYIHIFARSDDDRALHDHPWWNISVLVEGNYMEIVPVDPAVPNGPTTMHRRKAGQIVGRLATAAHRVALYRTGEVVEHARYPDGKPVEIPVKTIFITGPRMRAWGFWCREGWKRWTEYVRPRRDGMGSEVGEGCGELDLAPAPGHDSSLWTGRH